MQSSILSDSALPDQAWTEPWKSLRVMDVDESLLSGSNRRYHGNVVLSIMSQKVARSLLEFHSMGLVQFRQAYTTHLNQTWIGDFDDENLIGIPMTLMQEPVRSQYLGCLKSTQVTAVKGLTMLMVSHCEEHHR